MAAEQVITVLDVTEENIPCHSMLMMFRYWRELRQDRDMPDWHEFDPVRMAHYLPDIMLFDAREDGEFDVSLTGDVCCNELELPATKRPLRDFMPPENYEDVKKRLELVRESGQPHLVRKNLYWRVDADEMTRSTEYMVLFTPYRYGRNGVSHKICNMMYFLHREKPLLNWRGRDEPPVQES